MIKRHFMRNGLGGCRFEIMVANAEADDLGL